MAIKIFDGSKNCFYGYNYPDFKNGEVDNKDLFIESKNIKNLPFLNKVIFANITKDGTCYVPELFPGTNKKFILAVHKIEFKCPKKEAILSLSSFNYDKKIDEEVMDESQDNSWGLDSRLLNQGYCDYSDIIPTLSTKVLKSNKNNVFTLKNITLKGKNIEHCSKVALFNNDDLSKYDSKFMNLNQKIQKEEILEQGKDTSRMFQEHCPPTTRTFIKRGLYVDIINPKDLYNSDIHITKNEVHNVISVNFIYFLNKKENRILSINLKIRNKDKDNVSIPSISFDKKNHTIKSNNNVETINLKEEISKKEMAKKICSAFYKKDIFDIKISSISKEPNEEFLDSFIQNAKSLNEHKEYLDFVFSTEIENLGAVDTDAT